MNKQLLNYECLTWFNSIFYKKLLTINHLVSGQIKINKMHFPDGGEDEVNFWGYRLEKDGVKYLLSATDEEGVEIDLMDELPLRVNQTMKVAFKGDVYLQIKDYSRAKFKAEKSMTFKELVDKLSSFSHTNPEHYKLSWFMGLSQMFNRANYRMSTPAGFGKDSTVDILGNLIGGSATLETPTIAKLEFMTNYKWLAINEIVDLQTAEWRKIEQFLLSAGAFKPEITKHSRATSGVQEVIDISKFSISIMYNDIDHYPKPEKYVDFVTKKAVLDRFPPFRLYGSFSEDFNALKGVDLKKFVTDNLEVYKDILYNITYYKKNQMSLLTSYNTDKFKGLPERWQTNIGRLLNIIDLYSDDKAEFDKWCDVIVEAIEDYKDMLKYNHTLETVAKHLSESKYRQMHTEIKLIPKFTDKILYMKGLTNVKEKEFELVDEGQFW